MGWITDLLQELPLSAVQRERLALAEQKYALLETKQANMEAENNALKLDNVNLRQEIQRRDDVIQKEKSHSGSLDEVREKILLAVAKNEDLTTQRIAGICGVSELITKYHLEELRKTRMAGFQVTAGSDWSGTGTVVNWSVSQAGLSYLVAHGLIA